MTDKKFILSTTEKNEFRLNTDAGFIKIMCDIYVPTQKENPELRAHLEKVVESNLDLCITDLRGKKTYFSNLVIHNQNNQDVITFDIIQTIPKEIGSLPNLNQLYYSSFVDLCWNTGATPINTSLVPSTLTIPREYAIACEFGWVLPSKFVDSITATIGTLNSEILGGIAIDALLYGPIYF